MKFVENMDVNMEFGKEQEKQIQSVANIPPSLWSLSGEIISG